MAYKYYITDLYDGCIVGTNSKGKAEEMALCEDYFVLDVENNEWIMSDLSRVTPEEVNYD